MKAIPYAVGNGRTSCLTCGILFSVTVPLQKKSDPLLKSTITTESNSGNGKCTWCESKGCSISITKPPSDTPVISEKKCCDCGGELQSNRHKRCPPCKIAHKADYDRAYQRNYRASGSKKSRERVVHIVNCVYSKCRQPFKTVNLNVKTCSTRCSMLRAKERETHAYRAKRKRRKLQLEATP